MEASQWADDADWYACCSVTSLQSNALRNVVSD